ncbi:hypothetical protein MSG28_005277 [Choristoneura fumiferana]|uniref:Uncharacterized protein n=1 Tax=Choristoneura fumiferana TaxID=7141 RepID=A0ACC0JQV6_CHOFU|nr:hypothetical protein MSG28_005277 [Choristoneura fumiferana]
MSERYDEMHSQLMANQEDMSNLKKENSELRTSVSELSSRLEFLEQNSRECNVEITCLPEFKGELLQTTVVQLANVVSYPLQPTDILACKRVAKLNPNNERPRAVIVKLRSALQRDELLTAVIKYNKNKQDRAEKLNTYDLGIAGRKSPVFVSEHLSPAVKRLHAETRIAGKAKSYKFVWVRYGRIYVRKNEEASLLHIRNSSDLNQTWLHSGIADAELLDPRYTIFRRDRNLLSTGKKDGGGCLIAVSKKLPACRLLNWETECEDLWVAVIDDTVPFSKNRQLGRPKWFSSVLMRMMREKEKRRLIYKKSKNPRDYLEYDILRKRVKVKMDKDYSVYMASVEDGISCNSQNFWAYVKSLRKGKSTYPSTMQLNGVTADGHTDICNLFAKQFSSIFSASSPMDDYLKSRISTSPHCFASMSRIRFSESDVLKAIKSLDISKGAGPDGIPPFFIKKCASNLSLPLLLIFNKSLETSTFPALWKEANIVPVFKKGDETHVNNYRPISILSTFSKLFECLIYPRLAWHVKEQVSSLQHGFMPRKSTASNLICYVNDLSFSVDCRVQVDAIYTDFTSAFDKVDHNILLNKLLHDFSVSGEMLAWLRSYLTGRRQRVVKDGYMSAYYPTTSGVPQGSHLGPLLFVLFVNDIGDVIKNSKFLLYADDLKLYKEVKNTSDVELLQMDLDSISRWCASNGMVLNVSKCQHIKFTRNMNIINSSYAIGGVELEEVCTIRDLGVILDNKLSFISHIDSVVRGCFKMLGFVKRVAKNFKRPKTLETLYNTLVRSRLEYCSQVWNPSYQVHIDRLEKVQRSFTRYMAFKDNTKSIGKRTGYAGRLDHFGMRSLQLRREYLDLVLLHKIINGDIQESGILESLSFAVPRVNIRPSRVTTFRPRLAKSNLGKFSTVRRIQTRYNEHQKIYNLDVYSDSITSWRRKMLLPIKSPVCKIK